MKIHIASDHAGLETKDQLISFLREKKITVVDYGTNSADSVDYPDYANKVCAAVPTGSPTDEFGVLICGSGQGMAMRANKFSHIRAALCWSVEIAKLSREHNDANVLCLAGRHIELSLNKAILEAFLATHFAGGRHSSRVAKIQSPI